MFIVFAFLQIFLTAGKPMKAVPVLFIAVVLVAALFGEMTARFVSEPMNRFLRNRWGDGPNSLDWWCKIQANKDVLNSP